MKRLLIAVCVFACALTSTAQDVPLEYRVKAAYLFNFTKFVEWPRTAFDAQGAFNVCVAQRNPFGAALEAILSGETVAGRRLAVRVVRGANARCHVLFIPRSVRAAAYLRRARTAPVLTVGESPDFIEQGGVIRFVLQDGKVRFEINPEAAARSGLTISSRLLRLAMVPEGRGRR